MKKMLLSAAALARRFWPRPWPWRTRMTNPDNSTIVRNTDRGADPDRDSGPARRLR